MALQGLRSAVTRGGDPGSQPGVNPTTGAPAGQPAAEHTLLGCPSCGRPIPKGSNRCPGCGQRLVLDVPARKASMLVGAGVLAGFVVGGLLVGLTLPREAATAGTGAGAGSTAASALPAQVAANAAAALRGTTTLNGRLAADAEPLSEALAAKSFPVTDVVQVLRRMSLDARAAAAMVKALDAWPDAATHRAALASFYDDLSGQINDGLAASQSSAGAYKEATRSILETLARIAPLDTEARNLAGEAGIELPPVTIPDVLR